MILFSFSSEKPAEANLTTEGTAQQQTSTNQNTETQTQQPEPKKEKTIQEVALEEQRVNNKRK